MNKLYCDAKMKWGVSMPKQLKRLQNRDDDHVRQALYDILRDITSPTWTIDASIAWAILQRRDV